MGKAWDLGVRTPEDLLKAVNSGQLKYGELSDDGKKMYDTTNKYIGKNTNVQTALKKATASKVSPIVQEALDIEAKTEKAHPYIDEKVNVNYKPQGVLGKIETSKAYRTIIGNPAMQGYSIGDMLGAITMANPATAELSTLATGKAIGKGVDVLNKSSAPVTKALKTIAKKTPTPVKKGLGIGAASTGYEAVKGASVPDYVNPISKQKTLPSQVGASLRSGTGSLVSNLGSDAQWQGKDATAKYLKGVGANISKGYEVNPTEFTWKSLLDPNWYANNVASTLPSTAALIPLMFAGYKGSGAIAGKLGAGALMKTIVSSLGGASLSRPLESAMEAGNTYEAVLQQTGDENKADKAANRVFADNLKLAGLDAVQLGIAFAPAPAKLAAKVGKAGMAAGKLGIEAGTEGLEEGYQQAVQQQATGADDRSIIQQITNPDAAMQESMAIGGLLGVGMGGAGEINQMIKDIKAKTIESLPNEIMPQVKQRVTEHMNNGMAPTDALDTVLDEIAGTPEVAPIIQEITQQAAQETIKRRMKFTGSIPQMLEQRGGNIPSEIIPEQQEGQAPTAPEPTQTVQPEELQSLEVQTKEAIGTSLGASHVPTEMELKQGSFIDALRQSGIDPSSEIGQKLISEAGLDSRSLERNNDPVTGFIDGKHHDDTMKRVWVEAQKSDQPFSYGYIDIHNLSGLNAHRGTHEAANADLGIVADTIRQSLKTEGIGGAQVFKKGGDEYQVMAPFTDKGKLDIALNNAKIAIDKYAADNELSDIPHTKTGRSSGFGIDYAVNNFRDFNSPGELVEATDLLVGKIKEDDRNVTGSKAETTRTVTPSKQTGGINESHRQEAGGTQEEAPGGKQQAEGQKIDLKVQEEIIPAETEPEEPAASKPDYEITKTQHTKTGADIWVVKPTKRLSTEEFAAVRTEMKKIGGSWSRFTHGFNFNEDPAAKLLPEQESKQAAEKPDRVPPIRNARDQKLTPVGPFRLEQEELDIPEQSGGWMAVDANGIAWSVSSDKARAEEHVTALNNNPKYNTAENKPEKPINETKEVTTKTGKTSVQSKQEEELTPSSQIANFVIDKLNKNEKITNPDLWKAATEAYGGKQSENKFTPKDAYDAMELGVNKWLLEQNMFYDDSGALNPVDRAEMIISKLQKALDLLPTQANRTAEMDEFQQFSTPPSIAYVASWVANMGKNDTVLEPSAGIGGLAVYGKIAGAKIIVNELSTRRAAVIREMGFDQVFTENAEQLNNILPKDVKPTVIIMNPPFSSTAGRTSGKNDTKNAIPHIEQALKRLEPRGRLVAIVGRGMANNTATFSGWWNKLRKEYTVQANIGINGKNYTKYGTSFDIQIVVIDKIGPNQVDTITGRVDKIEDILPRLEGIRNDRIEVMGSSNKQTEQNTGQSAVAKASAKSQTETRPKPAVSVPTDRVGTGERESADSGRSGTNGNQQSAGTSGPDYDRGGTTESNGLTDEAGTSPGNTVARPEGVSTDENTSGSSAVSSKQSESGNAKFDGTDPGSSAIEIKVEARGQKKPEAQKELTDAVYFEYVPQKLKVPGAKPHPADLVQSSAMASVEPPAPNYKPNLPKEVIENGKLSLAQIESVVYAGQSHQEVLPDGQRRGFFIGDGTGVGKGREISAIILDNMRQGRKKAVWVSINKALLKDAQRDYGDIGGDASIIFDHGKVKNGTKFAQKSGIAFTTYTTLGAGQNVSANGDLNNRSDNVTSRLDQLAEWLGADFDGVIAFDESHQMQNSLAMKGSRGTSKPAAMALAGVELQNRLPNARVVYVSATGATEVENLAYCDRLGLWGTGTPFANKRDFVSKVKSGGLAAMELVARDMKSMGMYIARNIGFNGVSYNTLEHKLTKDQTAIYDAMAEGWQIVLQNINEALIETGAVDADTGVTLNGNAKKNAMGAFWGAQQRFFNQILTSMQMPSAIKAIKKDVQDGKAVVIQLVNTNEAQLNRALSALEEGQTLEDLDMTPRGQLMMFLDKSFPIWQMERYEDDNGNIKSRPVLDSAGNPVINQEALAMKDELMAKIGAMKVPDGPLEILLNELGAENVAEITGRSRRVVSFFNDDTGRWEKKTETRSKNDMTADEMSFMDDRKQILVFSNAGGTGRSYHADRTKKNQRPRKHYLLQAGWTASTAVQGFGRTHRSNQASAPEYVLVTTDLKGQKRFMSSIARRLDQLGALTKGQRSAAGQGLFTEKDNLEGPMASDALVSFYSELSRGRIDDLNPKELLEKMGLAKLTDENGNLKEDPEARNVPKFLNRLLSLESSLQNRVFDEFAERLENLVERAMADGTMDVGMENFKADKSVVISEATAYTDERSQAETKLVEFEAYYRTKPLTFKEVQAISGLSGFKGYYRNTRSGKVYAVRSKGDTTLSNGAIVDSYYLYGQDKENKTITNELKFRQGNWEKIPADSIELIWEKELESMPEHRKQRVHLITGALLPIWDRLPSGKVRVVRVLTDDGRILLGRIIPESALETTLRKLGAESASKDLTPTVIVDRIMSGHEAVLSNGWRIAKRRVSGESRVEVIGNDLYAYRNELADAGVFSERIGYATRYFIPSGSQAAGTLENIIKYRPIVEIFKPGGESTGDVRFKAERSAQNVNTNEFWRESNLRSGSTKGTVRQRLTGAEQQRHVQLLAKVHGGLAKGFTQRSFKYRPEALEDPRFESALAQCETLNLKLIPFSCRSWLKVSKIDGIVSPDAMYINIDGAYSPDAVSWHETGHKMKNLSPEYGELKDLVIERVKDTNPAGMKQLVQFYRETYGGIYTADDVLEEFVSDMFTQAFSKEMAFFTPQELHDHLNGFIEEVLKQVEKTLTAYTGGAGTEQEGTAAKYADINFKYSVPDKVTIRPITKEQREKLAKKRKFNLVGLESLQAEMERDINAVTPKVTHRIGMQVEQVKESPKPRKPKGDKFSFDNQDFEERWQEAKGIGDIPTVQKLKELLITTKNQMTREYEFLPKTGKWAEVRYSLLTLQKQKGVAMDRTLRGQQWIILEMDANDYDLFGRKVILDDLYSDIERYKEQENELPFGLTPDTLESELDKVNEAVSENELVQEALTKRDRLWAEIKDEYLEAMDGIGYDASEKLSREKYFHHQVLEFADLNRKFGTGQKLKSPTNRGFLKQRQGSSKDYNTEYMQAEVVVMGTMLHDIEIARTVKKIDDHYNVADQLKADAKKQNKDNFDSIVENENAAIQSRVQRAIKEEDWELLGKLGLTQEAINSDKFDIEDIIGPTALAIKKFNMSMGRAFSELKKMAQSGKLWEGENNEWAAVIDKLSKGKENALDVEEVGVNEMYRYFSILAQKGEDGSMQAAMILKNTSGKREFIKEKLGKQFKTWEDLIPEGYVAWQPREGTAFYFANSISEQLATQLFEKELESVGLSAADIRKVLVRGQKYKQFVIPEELALTLDNLKTGFDQNVASELLKYWKVYQLISPPRVIKYNIRNLTGDADAAFCGNPSTFKKVPQAFNELYQVFAGDRAMTPEMREWFKRGGMQTLLQAQENININEIKLFKNIVDAKSKQQKAKELPLTAWQKYWKTARMSTDFREALLRYAAYTDYLEQMQSDPNGRPKNFGASIPEEIMALHDIRDRAFVLSNQLLGAYDQVSVTGQKLRQYLIPFWSWLEVNPKRYVQLIKNAANNGNAASTMGRALGAKTPIVAYRLGKFAIKAAGFSVLLFLYNMTFWEDEEKELPNDVRRYPHIILGRNDDGTVRYFNRMGAFADFMEWFGADEAPYDVADFLNGKRTLKEITHDNLKKPVNKIANGVTPFLKLPAELIMGLKMYPNAFKPMPMRDKWEYLAQQAGLAGSYKSLMGRPKKQGDSGQGVEKLFWYESDPREAAYYDIMDQKRSYQRKMGLSTGGFSDATEKSTALYYYKMAIKYKDREAADKYLLEYVQKGGTGKGLRQSLSYLNPIRGLGETGNAFADSLTEEDLVKLNMAIEFYREVIAEAGEQLEEYSEKTK